ncbi:hypothetical protein IWW40_005871 [Coemansia sp. RSA 1250]|nr:hypothetical protein IWW40_005871 [Coemansia sp. RSA 1250]
MKDTEGTTSTIRCTLCNADLTLLDALARNSHVEQCLDTSVLVQEPTADYATATDIIDVSGTLDRLVDCPVCGKAWKDIGSLRSAHASACATHHGLSSKDFASLLEMFRDSLNGSSAHSAGSGSVSRTSTSSSSSAFIKRQAGKAPARKPLKKTSKKLNSSIKPIDSWFAKQTSGKLSADNSDIDTQSTTSSASSLSRLQTCQKSDMLVYEISEDEDFKSTKVRLPLKQSVISTRRVGKKRQEVLDEFDDDLNEGKALSLSLLRNSDIEPHKKTTAKRRNGRGAECLDRSDILPCKEAQDYIRQRASALEQMDSSAIQSSFPSSDDCKLQPEPSLWNIGSLNSISRELYCPIFENYKIRHDDHHTESDCIDDIISHMLQSLAFEREKGDGEPMRRAYLLLLEATHKAYARAISAQKCADWVETRGGPNEQSEIVLLSSSETSSLPADPANIGTSREHNLPREPKQPQPLPSMPNYSQMPLDDLKKAAENYGLRINTPRRLLIHQLTSIWQQTHKTDLVADSEIGTSSTSELYIQLCQYIRSNRDLYERILCYQVLDLDSAYSQISAHVPCTKYALRKFFDSEGIVTSAVLGALIPETTLSTRHPMATKVVVHSVDTPLSRFVPMMLSQARMAEQRLPLSDIELPASVPTPSFSA